MADDRLKSIKQRCDTTGARLQDWQKNLLCRVIDNPGQYDGFQSNITESYEGKDPNGRWSSTTNTQYTIHVNDENLSIDKHSEHSCDDGYHNTLDSTLTGVKDIVEALRTIFSNL